MARERHLYASVHSAPINVFANEMAGDFRPWSKLDAVWLIAIYNSCDCSNCDHELPADRASYDVGSCQRVHDSIAI